MTARTPSIGNRIAYLRRTKCLTQEVVGKWIERTGSHISNVENSKAELLPSELETLANRFGVHILYLVGGVPPEVAEAADRMTMMAPDKRLLANRLIQVVGG